MEAVPPRLTLLFFAMPFQLVAEPLYWLYGREGNVAVIALCMALWFAWFALVFLMAVPPVDRWLLPRLRQLKRGVVVITVVLAVVGMAELVGMYLLETGTVRGTRLTDEVTGYFRYNDATAMSHQASETLLEGENPYTEANIIAALEKHPAATVTPLRQGDFAEVFPRPSQEQLKEVLSEARESGNGAPEELESKVSYPAGSFLFQTPLVALGLEDLRIFYLICAVAAGSIVLWRAPSALRPWAVAAFLVSVVLWNLIATGTIDTLYVLFVLLGWMLRSRLFVASVFMGLAAATKQIAWAYALFFLILVLRERGWKPAFSSAGVAAGVFAAINVPFIFDASRHWVEGILSPVLDPMFPGGVGVMAFSVAGILPPAPADFHHNGGCCPAGGSAVVLPKRLPVSLCWPGTGSASLLLRLAQLFLVFLFRVLSNIRPRVAGVPKKAARLRYVASTPAHECGGKPGVERSPRTPDRRLASARYLSPFRVIVRPPQAAESISGWGEVGDGDGSPRQIDSLRSQSSMLANQHHKG